MKRLQSRLAIALLFGGLFILAFVATVLLSGPLDFLYRSAAGLSTARSVAQAAAILAAIGLFITAVIVAIPIAFQPTSRFRRALHILPLYFLGFTLLVVGASFLGIGATGTLLNVGMAPITLIAAAIILGTLASTIAIAIATARVHLAEATLRRAMTMMGVSSVPSVIAAVAVAISVIIVSTTQPSFSFGGPGGSGPGGGPGGQPGQPGGQNGPGRSGTQAAQIAPGTAASDGAIQGTAAAPGVPEQGGPAPIGTQAATQPAQGTRSGPGAGGAGNQAGGPERPGGPGGGPGGPGGGPTSFIASFRLAGGFVVLFALIALVSTITGLRRMRRTTSQTSPESAPSSAAPISYRHEAGSVLVSAIAVSVVIFLVIQLVPVTRTNPPVQSTVQWDSPQTEQLWDRTCANCHSNTTNWPWYSYVAPSSWLTTLHVKDAREQFNISEMDHIPAFQKSQFPNNAEQNIRRGTMPPADFLLLHPEARLSEAEKQQLIDGLKNSLGK